MTTYQIGYQLSDYRGRGVAHRSIKAAVRRLLREQAMARRCGDLQGLCIVRADGEPLTDAESASLEALLYGEAR